MLAHPAVLLPRIDRRSRRLGTDQSLMDVFLDSRHPTGTSEYSDTDESGSGPDIAARRGARAIHHSPVHLHHIPQGHCHSALTPISWEDPRYITLYDVTTREGWRAADRLGLRLRARATSSFWRRNDIGMPYDGGGEDIAVLGVKMQGLVSAERSTVDWHSDLEVELESACETVFQTSM